MTDSTHFYNVIMVIYLSLILMLKHFTKSNKIFCDY